MITVTFFNLGNADTSRINLKDGRRLLIDYANKRAADDPTDKRCDLPKLLREDMNGAKRDTFSVVAFTHLDDDHVLGASSFFEFDHAAKYQGGDRFKIETLWVPAAAICETQLTDDARVIQEEAKYRLRNGYGIKVFSRPQVLQEWLAGEGLTIDDRDEFFVDAGQLVGGWSLLSDGVEFFAHSPHATRTDDRGVIDRNSDSLVFQARFLVDGATTDILYSADVTYEDWAQIIDITKYHGNDDRLHWNVYKLPHHCSYTAIGPDKGERKTLPTEQVKWLCEESGEPNGYVISPSKPIPSPGTAEDKDVQPPHREAANYYKEDVVSSSNFLVTMEEPNALSPKPIVIEIGRDGAVKKALGTFGIATTVGGAAPRAGRKY